MLKHTRIFYDIYYYYSLGIWLQLPCKITSCKNKQRKPRFLSSPSIEKSVSFFLPWETHVQSWEWHLIVYSIICQTSLCRSYNIKEAPGWESHIGHLNMKNSFCILGIMWWYFYMEWWKNEHLQSWSSNL